MLKNKSILLMLVMTLLCPHLKCDDINDQLMNRQLEINNELNEDSIDDIQNHEIYSYDHMLSDDLIAPEQALVEVDSPPDIVQINKKDSTMSGNNFVDRGKQHRRHQAARWDIGFGKRSNLFKRNQFLDILFGKRAQPKLDFGRKQFWDVHYGKK